MTMATILDQPATPRQATAVITKATEAMEATEVVVTEDTADMAATADSTPTMATVTTTQVATIWAMDTTQGPTGFPAMGISIEME